MIIYNVTVKVMPEIHESWLDWLKETHVPEVLDTGCFREARVLRMLEVDESEGPTYTVQYTAESKSDYNRYIERHAPVMRQRSAEQWGERFIAFRSVMEIVH